MMDRERMVKLVRERARALVLYARQWVDAGAAEDVVQEALARLLTEPEEPRELAAWMYVAVRHGAIDAARAGQRRKRREEVVAKERREWFQTTPDALIDARAAEEAL